MTRHNPTASTAANLQADPEREVAAPIAALAAFCALAVAMGIGRFAFTPLLPMMEDDAGLSVAQGSWLAAANYLGYLAGALAATVIAPRASRAIQAGLVITVLTTGAMALDAGFGGWLVLRTVTGFASAWVLVFAAAWAGSVLARADRRALNGPVFAGVGAGIAITGLVSLVMERSGATSAETWGALAGAAAVLSLVAWAPMDTASIPAAARSGRVRGVGVIRLCACYAAFGIGYIIPATFLPVLAKETLHDPMLFQWAWPVFGAAAAVSTLVAAAIARRVGNISLWIGSHLVMACGVLLPVVSHSFAAVIASSLLVGGTFMVATLGAIGAAHEIAGDRARGVIAAMTVAFATGQVLGPIANSVLVANGQRPAIAWIAAAVVLAASALALLPLRTSTNDTENKK
jgi:predicted MFS family arabinose efflux permease